MSGGEDVPPEMEAWVAQQDPVIWRPPILNRAKSHFPRLLHDRYPMTHYYKIKATREVVYVCASHSNAPYCSFKVKLLPGARFSRSYKGIVHVCGGQKTEGQVENYLRMDRAKAAQAANVGLVPSVILGGEAEGVDLDDLHDPDRTLKAQHGSLNRVKAFTIGYPRSPMYKDKVLPEKLLSLKTGRDRVERILLYDSGAVHPPDAHVLPTRKLLLEAVRKLGRTFIFTYQDALHLIKGRAAEGRMAIIDGTFSCAPINYYQVRNEVGARKYIAAIWAVMSGKSRAEYNLVAGQLFKLVPGLKFGKIMSDFEGNIFRSFALFFPGVVETKCYYHFRAALRKRAQMEGLTVELRNKKGELRTQYLMIAALSFVPAEEVKTYFAELMEYVDESGRRWVSSKLDNFARYFGKNFLGVIYRRYPSTDVEARTKPLFNPTGWNVEVELLAGEDLSQVAGESGNRVLVRHLGVHPGICRFIFSLKTLIGHYRRVIAAHRCNIEGAPPPPMAAAAAAAVEMAFQGPPPPPLPNLDLGFNFDDPEPVNQAEERVYDPWADSFDAEDEAIDDAEAEAIDDAEELEEGELPEDEPMPAAAAEPLAEEEEEDVDLALEEDLDDADSDIFISEDDDFVSEPEDEVEAPGPAIPVVTDACIIADKDWDDLDTITLSNRSKRALEAMSAANSRQEFYLRRKATLVDAAKKRERIVARHGRFFYLQYLAKLLNPTNPTKF